MFIPLVLYPNTNPVACCLKQTRVFCERKLKIFSVVLTLFSTYHKMHSSNYCSRGKMTGSNQQQQQTMKGTFVALFALLIALSAHVSALHMVEYNLYGPNVCDSTVRRTMPYLPSLKCLPSVGHNSSTTFDCDANVLVTYNSTRTCTGSTQVDPVVECSPGTSHSSGYSCNTYADNEIVGWSVGAACSDGTLVNEQANLFLQVNKCTATLHQPDGSAKAELSKDGTFTYTIFSEQTCQGSVLGKISSKFNTCALSTGTGLLANLGSQQESNNYVRFFPAVAGATIVTNNSCQNTSMNLISLCFALILSTLALIL
jgi:hypothetical protein